MKHFLSLLLVCLMVCNVSFAENNYDQDFDNIINAINEYVEKAQYNTTANIMVWQEDGPQNCVTVLADIIKAETYDDMIWKFDMELIFGKYTASYVHETYRQNYFDIIDEEENETIKKELKAFKDKYEQKHEDVVEALKDYYTKAIAYGEFATAPSGNLINYSQNNATFCNELEELKTDAEFEK